MSKISDIAKASNSESFKKLNPEFFGKIVLKLSKPESAPFYQVINKNVLKAIRAPKNDVLVNQFKSIWYDLCDIKLEEEFKFHPERRFRCDFCHLATRTCIEIEGGIFSKKGGHSSISGIMRDIEKYNELTYLGFRLIRLHSKSIDVPNLTRLVHFLNSGRA